MLDGGFNPSIFTFMSEGTLTPDEALAVLMSFPEVGGRRDFVAEDLKNDRRLASISRLSLALVLEAPFGQDCEWRRMCRAKFPIEVTRESAIGLLRNPVTGGPILDYFWDRMRKPRVDQLKAIGMSDEEDDISGIDFAFTNSELEEINDVLVTELGDQMGGEIFWSRDPVVSPSGDELVFVFSMLSRTELLGCVCGPYDDEDELDHRAHGLRDLDDPEG